MLCFLRALVYNSIRERLALYHTEAVKKTNFYRLCFVNACKFLNKYAKKAARRQK